MSFFGPRHDKISCHLCSRQLSPVHNVFIKENDINRMWFSCKTCSTAFCAECHALLLGYVSSQVNTLVSACKNGGRYVCIVCRGLCSCMGENWGEDTKFTRDKYIQTDIGLLRMCHHPEVLCAKNTSDECWEQISTYVPVPGTSCCITVTPINKCTVSSYQEHPHQQNLRSFLVVQREVSVSAPVVSRLEEYIVGIRFKYELEVFNNSVWSVATPSRRAVMDFILKTPENSGFVHVDMRIEQIEHRVRSWLMERFNQETDISRMSQSVYGIKNAGDSMEIELGNEGSRQWTPYRNLVCVDQVHVAVFVYKHMTGLAHCALGMEPFLALLNSSVRGRLRGIWALQSGNLMQRRTAEERLKFQQLFK